MAAEAMTDIRDLDPLAKRLNAASDEFTQALETIQQKLNALSLGVEAWLESHQLEESGSNIWTELDGVPRPSYDEDEAEFVKLRRNVAVQQLGYGRLGDGWALLVRTMSYPQTKTADGWEPYSDEEAIETDRKPLLRSSRQIRVKAIDQIPLLIDKLHDEAEAVITAVEKAKKIAESMK